MATYSSYKGRPVSQQMKNKMCQVLTKDKNKAKKVSHHQEQHTPFWKNIKQHKR